MGFIVDRPGLSLLVVGILMFFVRPLFEWLPLIGGAMNTILLLASIFFVVGGVWMFFMNRSGDPA